MDFGICLQGVRKVMGFLESADDGLVSGRGVNGVRKAGREKKEEVKKRDWGLKEGEMIKVEIKGLGSAGESRRRREEEADDEKGKLFSIKPPPPAGSKGGGEGGISFLPPPPSARDVKAEIRGRSRGDIAPVPEKGSAKELGFDDGEFGEFQ
ncbi:MAG: hypothetical protein Q9201_004814 [Fulgogasparrea decipioides]